VQSGVGRRCASGRTIFLSYHPSTAPNVARSAKIAKSTWRKLGECDEDPYGEGLEVRFWSADGPCPRRLGGGAQKISKPRHPEYVVRLTGDCPLIDPGIIDAVVAFAVDGSYDYASNTLEPTYTDGLDVEVIRFSTLERAWKQASQDYLDPNHAGRYWPSGFADAARSLLREVTTQYRLDHPSAPTYEIDQVRRKAAMDIAVSGRVSWQDAAIALVHEFRRFMLSGGEGFLHKLVGVGGKSEDHALAFYGTKVLSLTFSLTSRVLGLIGLIWLIRVGRWDMVVLFGGVILVIWAGIPFKGGPRYRAPVELTLQFLAVAGWFVVSEWIKLRRNAVASALRT